MRAKLSMKDYELISAYLDGQLSPRDLSHFEQEIKVRPDLKTALEEMGQTRALLRSAPRRQAPRNFTLTPAMVEPRRTKPSIGRMFPALSFASALAALVLVATVIFQMMPGLNISQDTVNTAASTGAGPTQSLMQALPESPEAAIEKAAPESMLAQDNQAQQPPVITWGGSPYSDSTGPTYGLGGRGGGGGGDGSGGNIGIIPSPNGELLVPQGGVESLPPASSTTMEGVQPQENFDRVQPIEGSGPILGVPQSEQAGQYVVPLPTALPPQVIPSPMLPEQADGIEQPPSVPVLLWAQIALGAVALICGLAAFGIWRKSR